jgi:hypothetical protein
LINKEIFNKINLLISKEIIKIKIIRYKRIIIIKIKLIKMRILLRIHFLMLMKVYGKELKLKEVELKIII